MGAALQGRNLTARKIKLENKEAGLSAIQGKGLADGSWKGRMKVWQIPVSLAMQFAHQTNAPNVYQDLAVI